MKLLLTTAGAGEQRQWPLEGTSLRVGRSSKHEIQLADATVSKDHAEIERRGAQWLVRDLESRNGTRVNGVEATDPIPLKEGDLLEVGKVLLRVTHEGGLAPELSALPDLSSSVKLRAKDVLERPTARTGPDAIRLVRLLTDAGRVLVLPRPLPETCEEILQFVEKAVPASRLILLLREKEDQEPVQIAARCRGGSSRSPLAISRTILDMVLNECASVVTGDALADVRFRQQQSIVAQSIHSAMAVPLFDNERVLGVLYADTSDPMVAFGKEQLEVLTLLGNMAAVKITNARLLQAEQARARMAAELASASRIQRHLLRPPPQIPGYGWHARIDTCYEMGGDLYDFHVRPDGQVFLLVGDVSGKGMGAALLMSSLLSSARVLYEDCENLGTLAARLNAVMHRSTDSRHFVTVFLGLLDPVSGRLTYVNAGHNAPLVAAEGGTLRELPANGPPIAVLPEFPYQAQTVELAPNDLVAIFSDGIPEARRAEEFYGEERLAYALLARAPRSDLETLGNGVLEDLDQFLAGTPREDDITLVLLRRESGG